MKAIDKLLGICLLAGKENVPQIVNHINKDWLNGDFQTRAFNTIKKMSECGVETNVLTLVKQMQVDGLPDKSYISKISQLTADVGPTDIMNWKTIISMCDWSHREKLLFKMNQDFSMMLTNGSINMDRAKKLLQNAINVCEFNIPKQQTNVDAIFQIMEMHDKAKQGELNGILLPYNSMRQVVLLENVDFMVIGARPAMGKTAYVVSTAVAMALRGERVMIFALEMSKVQMMRRIVANLTAVDSNLIKYGQCNNYQLEMIKRVQEMPELNNITIIEGNQTISDIARYVQSEKPSIVFVDYLQKIKPDGNVDMYTAVTKASNGLKEICQMQHIPIIAMAQLSRPDSHKAGKRPSLPDLRQSGEIEQDASIVGFIHRPEYYGDDLMEDGSSSQGKAEFIVAKNREGEVGVYQMQVNLKISKFRDAEQTTIMSHSNSPF